MSSVKRCDICEQMPITPVGRHADGSGEVVPPGDVSDQLVWRDRPEPFPGVTVRVVASFRIDICGRCRTELFDHLRAFKFTGARADAAVSS